MKKFLSPKNYFLTVSVRLYQELHKILNNKRNTEKHSRNHCCRGKAISITYSECVCVCVCV